MKQKSNIVLLLLFLLSTCFYLMVLFDSPLLGVLLPGIPHQQIFYLLSLHAIPAFCLQLLLCRVSRCLPVRLLPLLIPALPLTAALFQLWRNNGAPELDSAIFLLLAIAPALACLLGWVVHGLCQLVGQKKKATP